MTRRTALFALASFRMYASAAKAGAVFPSAARKFEDALTELPVYRLTDPAHSSLLPLYYARFTPRSNGFLVYASDQAGSLQAFRLNLKTGESRQLTTAADLDPESLMLLPGDREMCYFDGASLRILNLSNLKEREIYRVRDGWQRGAGLMLERDGTHLLFIETKPPVWQIRILRLAKAAAATVLETGAEMRHPMPRPQPFEILYRSQDSLWLCGPDGQNNRRLGTAPGGLGPAVWSPDFGSVLYLNFPPDRSKRNSIREYSPEKQTDSLVAQTSQFTHFGANTDASMFAGASASKASPTILLLHRLTRRELTICEHRSKDLSLVKPVFSPDSERVYFESDREGKPAIYFIPVEKLVEPTDR